MPPHGSSGTISTARSSAHILVGVLPNHRAEGRRREGVVWHSLSLSATSIRHTRFDSNARREGPEGDRPHWESHEHGSGPTCTLLLQRYDRWSHSIEIKRSRTIVNDLPPQSSLK